VDCPLSDLYQLLTLLVTKLPWPQLTAKYYLLLPGTELPLVESFGLLNDLFTLLLILDAGYPVLDLHLADVLFNVILPSVLGSSL